MDMLRSDRAVSESLGFILICMMIFISFTMIFAIGYPMYNNYVDSNHMQNVEKSFHIVASNANLVAMQKSILASSELKMYGGTLATRDTGILNVTYYDINDDLIGSNEITLSALEYSKGTDKVAYVDGSVCRSGLSGAIMLQNPEISDHAGMVLIPMISLYNSEVSIAGNTLARIEINTPYYSKYRSLVRSPKPIVINDVKKISINITGDFAPCFRSYFQDNLEFTPDTGVNGEPLMSKTYSSTTKLIMTMSSMSISVN
jgi:hypothetical protein